MKLIIPQRDRNYTQLSLCAMFLSHRIYPKCHMHVYMNIYVHYAHMHVNIQCTCSLTDYLYVDLPPGVSLKKTGIEIDDDHSGQCRVQFNVSVSDSIHMYMY